MRGQAHAGALGGYLKLLGQIFQHQAEIDARSLQRQLAGLGLREQQQRAHDLRQAVDVLERVEHGFAILLGAARRHQCHLQLAADGGDGSAQLMRNVGGELLHLPEGGLQALDHAIEGEDQIVQLIAGVTRGNAQSEVRTGDALRRLRHIAHRSKRAAGHQPAHQPAEEGCAGEDADKKHKGVSAQDHLILRERSPQSHVIRGVPVLVPDHRRANQEQFAR